MKDEAPGGETPSVGSRPVLRGGERGKERAGGDRAGGLGTLVGPIYLVGVIMVVFPLLELALTSFPLAPGQTSWRFGASGLLSRAALTPLAGDLLIVGAAVAGRHQLMLRVLAVLNGLAALVLLAVIGLFLLDALEMRSLTQPGAVRTVEVASGVAALKLAVVAAGCGWLALAAHRARGAPKTSGGG